MAVAKVKHTRGLWGLTESQLLDLMTELQETIRNSDSGVASHSENGVSTGFSFAHARLLDREHAIKCALHEVNPEAYELPPSLTLRRVL